MSKDGGALIWCPFPDLGAARDISERLVAERIVACANIIPGVESVYLWKGAVEHGAEVGVLFKTTASGLAVAAKRLEELHPYDTPAIMGWYVDSAPDSTLDWLAQQVDEKEGT